MTEVVRETLVDCLTSFDILSDDSGLRVTLDDQPRCRVRSCPDYGDPDFGEATCPSWHAEGDSATTGSTGGAA